MKYAAFFLLVILAAFQRNAFADYFTFQGIIRSITGPDASLQNLVGQEVTYIFLADYSNPGYYLQTNGEQYVIPVSAGGFYSELIKGPDIFPEFGYQYDPTLGYSIVEGHLGSRLPEGLGSFYSFHARHNGHHTEVSQNLFLQFPQPDPFASTWYGMEESYGPNNLKYFLNTDLRLMSISQENPTIPEPNSLALLAIGGLVFGLGGFSYRRLNRKK